jgi:1-acyl-sn-glycerol-3-phosphate acyltransferase
MWWNYRKPKPLKRGAYTLAAQNMVPVLPVFITMEDSDVLDADGFFVQEYTINIGKPIYPESSLSARKNSTMMMDENARVWKEIYEDSYGIPLEYEGA